MSGSGVATLYLPRETTALGLGADAVARAILAESGRRGTPLELVRTGSRGACWLEPLLEVATPAGRIAYGPLRPRDIASLFDAGLMTGADHALRLGPVERIPYFAGQERVTCASPRRRRSPQPRRLPRARRLCRARGGARDDARAHRAGDRPIPDSAAAAARPSRPASSGGRCSRQPAGQKYVVCNADEGDSGTFSDRHDHGRRPLRAPRGHDHRGHRDRAHAAATSTCAANTRTRTRHSRPPSPRLAPRLSRREHPR